MRKGCSENKEDPTQTPTSALSSKSIIAKLPIQITQASQPSQDSKTMIKVMDPSAVQFTSNRSLSDEDKILESVPTQRHQNWDRKQIETKLVKAPSIKARVAELVVSQAPHTGSWEAPIFDFEAKKNAAHESKDFFQKLDAQNDVLDSKKQNEPTLATSVELESTKLPEVQRNFRAEPNDIMSTPDNYDHNTIPRQPSLAAPSIEQLGTDTLPHTTITQEQVKEFPDPLKPDYSHASLDCDRRNVATNQADLNQISRHSRLQGRERASQSVQDNDYFSTPHLRKLSQDQPQAEQRSKKLQFISAPQITVQKKAGFRNSRLAPRFERPLHQPLKVDPLAQLFDNADNYFEKRHQRQNARPRFQIQRFPLHATPLAICSLAMAQQQDVGIKVSTDFTSRRIPSRWQQRASDQKRNELRTDSNKKNIEKSRNSLELPQLSLRKLHGKF